MMGNGIDSKALATAGPALFEGVGSVVFTVTAGLGAPEASKRAR